MMPVMQHPAQAKKPSRNWAELGEKPARNRTWLFSLLDDVGWMDVGFNGGGGVAVGNPTPDIDAVGQPGADFNFGILNRVLPQLRRHDSHRTIPIHHGILMPPMYEANRAGLEWLTTLPQLPHDQGATSPRLSGNGIWGENKESQPQNVGFDDFPRL